MWLISFKNGCKSLEKWIERDRPRNAGMLLLQGSRFFQISQLVDSSVGSIQLGVNHDRFFLCPDSSGPCQIISTKNAVIPSPSPSRLVVITNLL